MRLAIITHKVVPNDGQGRVNYEIALEFLKTGNQLILVCEDCAPEIASHPNATLISIKSRLPSRLLRDLSFAWRSSRWLQSNKHSYDLTQANGFVTFARITVAAAHFIHTAWLVNPAYPFQWSDFKPYSFYQRLYSVTHALLEKRTFRRAQIVVAVSGSVATDLQRIGVARYAIRTIYNGVDLNEFTPGPPQRKHFGLPEGHPIALFIGDLMTPRKNLETVLKATKTVPELHLAIVGKADSEAIRSKGTEYGIPERLHLIGFTTEAAALMRSVDLLVMPSWYEPYGMVALEALATGLPVALSANAGAAEVLGNVCQVIDAPNDAIQLAHAMRRCLTPESDANYQQRRDLAAQWSWQTMAEDYIALYREIYASEL